MPTFDNFSYQIKYKRISSLRLKITSYNNFTISAPYLTPKFIIEKFIRDHQDWIINHNPLPQALSTNLAILNINYQLVIQKSHRDSLVIIDFEQKIYINTSVDSPAHIKKIIDQKLRVHALKLINHHLRQLKSFYGFKYQKVSIRNQSSRFGSCSSTGNLSFNWQIILFPYQVFQHILLHELTHTLHHNHSPCFWSQLAKYDPQFISHRYWLKKEASKYMIFSI